KNGLIEGVHGKGGGYRLTRDPSDYTAGEILRLAEDGLAPISCLKDDAPPCRQAAECRTLPMWQGFYKLINEYFDGITIQDLMQTDAADNYVI
ncbi:MAG: Rrf2 family transcriptional regulator, partial [Firmicutes bacterium]|nr:Rrf2 family transcriptional regulator [Bacillota bacterium]